MNYNVLACMGLWWFLGLVGSGIAFAYMQDECPELAKDGFRDDLWLSLGLSIAGPAGLVGAFCGTGGAKHGCRLWRRKSS